MLNKKVLNGKTRNEYILKVILTQYDIGCQLTYVTFSSSSSSSVHDGKKYQKNILTMLRHRI